MGRYARNTPHYWLIDVEGIDPKTAEKIISAYDDGLDTLAHFPGLEDSIASAFDGLLCVLHDC